MWSFKIIISITYMILSTLTLSSAQRGSIFEAITGFLRDATELHEGEPPDATHILPEYDFVIVGAGTAGCVLSNRLTEVEDFTVLLIEAGGNEQLYMDIPVLATMLQFTDANWHYYTEPQTLALVIEMEKIPATGTAVTATAVPVAGLATPQ